MADDKRMPALRGKLSRVVYKPYAETSRTPLINPGGMPCPQCGGNSGVTDSRPRYGSIRRRRCCLSCSLRFTTWEVVGGNEPPARTIDRVIDEAEGLAERLRGFRVALKETAE